MPPKDRRAAPKSRKPAGKGKAPARGGFGDRKPAGRGFGAKTDRKPAGGKRDGARGSSFGDKKTYTKKTYGDKPYADRDSAPRGRSGAGAKSFGDRKPRSLRDKPFGEKSFGDKSFGEKKTYGDRKSYGDRKPYSDRDAAPRGRNGFGDKKFGDKKFGDKKFGDKRPAPRKPAYGRDDTAPRAFRPATPETKKRLNAERQSYGAPSPLYIFGVHPVTAALLNPKRNIRRILATENGFDSIRAAYDDAIADGLPRPQPVIVDKEDIERLVPRDAVHQDVLLDTPPVEETFLADILIETKDDENARVLVLDQVTDPHNVGAILRSASAFGAAAVVVQRLHAPDITGTLAKSASGAAEYVPLVREVNLSRAIEQLKDAGFFCIGLDERGKYSVAKTAPKNAKIALVLGAEGDGLRRLVGEKCDALAQLPTTGPIASLNVSNAAAVALYELVRDGK